MPDTEAPVVSPTPIQNLAAARRATALAKSLLAGVRAEFEQNYADLIRAEKEAKEYEEACAATVRTAALEAYAATGDKKGYAGAEVKAFTVLDYEEPRALAWAVEKGLAVKLDAKAFEALAKSTPLDFVTVRTEDRVTIATDLSAFLDSDAAS